MRNLRVATFPAPSTAYVLQEKMFKDAGLPPKISQGAFGSLLTMLRTHQADVALAVAIAEGGSAVSDTPLAAAALALRAVQDALGEVRSILV